MIEFHTLLPVHTVFAVPIKLDLSQSMSFLTVASDSLSQSTLESKEVTVWDRAVTCG